MLKRPELPQEYAEAFRASVNRLLRPKDPARERLRQGALEGIPVLHIGLDQVDQRSIGPTEPSGFLVVTRLAEREVFGAEVLTQGDGLKIEGLFRDGRLPGLLKKLEQVLVSDEFKDLENGRITLLSIPDVLTDALLISSPPQQFIVPVRVPSGVPINRVYSVEDFFEALAKPAAAFRKFAREDTSDIPEPDIAPEGSRS